MELLWGFATVGCDDPKAIHRALLEASLEASVESAVELLWCMSQLGASPQEALATSLCEELRRDLWRYELQRLVLAAVAMPREVAFLDPLQEVVGAKILTMGHLDASRSHRVPFNKMH